MAESKTARASAVKQTTEVKIVPDVELLRLLKLDRASGIYPGVQGTDAALRRIAELEDLCTGAESTALQYATDLAAAKEKVTELEGRIEGMRASYEGMLANRDLLNEEIKSALALLNKHLTGRVYDELEDAIRNLLQGYITMKDNIEAAEQSKQTLSETLQAELEPLPSTPADSEVRVRTANQEAF